MGHQPEARRCWNVQPLLTLMHTGELDHREPRDLLPWTFTARYYVQNHTLREHLSRTSRLLTSDEVPSRFSLLMLCVCYEYIFLFFALPVSSENF